MKYQFSFSQKDVDAVARLKWCRQQLGPRGQRWDFVGGRRVTILIREDQDAELYNKIWRFWNVLKGDNKKESYHIAQ